MPSFLLDQLPTLLITVPLQRKSVPNRVLSLRDLERQRAPNAREHKGGPFPPERVDHDTEDEPVRQLRVSEEVEGAGWCMTLDGLCHVNPFLHPLFLWCREGIDEEHQKQACIDSNMVLKVSGVSLRSSA